MWLVKDGSSAQESSPLNSRASHILSEHFPIYV